jgi:hypothetical protein
MLIWHKLLMAVICVSAIAGCNKEPPIRSDEAWLRSELQIPAAARRITLQAVPAGMGTIGRDALRIFAAFEMTREDFDDYRQQFRPADWLPLPIAAQINYFHDGPIELKRFTSNGSYVCEVATPDEIDHWKRDFDAGSTSRIERYRIILLDAASLQLHVVYKQYH